MRWIRLACVAVAACSYAPLRAPNTEDAFAHDAPVAPPDALVDAAPALACATDPLYVANPATRVRYRAVTQPATWAQARDACVADEARLVVIEDLTESTYVHSLLDNLEIWIGLSDLVTEGTFVWVDGSPLTFENWRPDGNPNGGTNQNCVEIDESGPTWNDEVCEQAHAYVCECL
jgi:hypothetical protein